MWASEAEKREQFHATTVVCDCPEEARVWDCVDCPVHGADAMEECRREQEAEIWAEGAYVRMMEMGTPETWAEEDRERQMEAWYNG